MEANMRRAKILIVDDYAPNILALKVTLDSPHYELFEAESATAALQLCEQQEFALIVLDIQMPDIDGFETARLIKRSDLNRETPIIFVTAVYKEDPFVKKGYEVGAIDYFGKPFDPGILKAKVNIYTELYLKTKRLEETNELLKSHDHIKTLLDAIPAGLVIADRDGQIVATNSRAAQIWLGVGKRAAKRFDEQKGWWPRSGKQLSSDDWPIARTLKTGVPCKDELINIECSDGTRKNILNSAFPFKSQDGKTVGAVSVFKEFPNGSSASFDRECKSWDILLTS